MQKLARPVSALSRRGTFGLFLGALATAGGARAADSTGWAAVDALGEAVVADHIVPGFSISVMKAGAFVYSRGFGLANLEIPTPATPHHVYRVGSITKQFTGAAIVLLAEEGKLSIDDPLSKHLPAFPRAAEVTLRQMLTHTSGIGNYTNQPSLRDFLMAARIDYDDAALFKAMIDMTRPAYVFEPGAGWAYSNTAYVLLGLIVQKVAGQSLAAFYKRRLFDPAGMTRTAMDDAADVVPDRASGYSGHPGSSTAFDNTSFISMTFPGGAGSIRSTTEDLCRWQRALLGGKIVKPAGLAEMLKPGLIKGGVLPTAADKKTPVKYGFGLGIGEFEGHSRVGHEGGINGFITYLDSFPDQQATVAMLMNGDPFGRPSYEKRMGAIQKAAWRLALA